MKRKADFARLLSAAPTLGGAVAVLGCAGILLFASAGTARATSYIINIRQVPEGRANSVRMICSDKSDALCRRDMTLSIDGREQIVAVIAFVEPGNLYVKFRLGDAYLFVGSQPYLHIAISNRSDAHDSLDLSEAPPLAGDDVPDRLYHRPVLRRSWVRASLEIAVYPGH